MFAELEAKINSNEAQMEEADLHTDFMGTLAEDIQIEGTLMHLDYSAFEA